MISFKIKVLYFMVDASNLPQDFWVIVMQLYEQNDGKVNLFFSGQMLCGNMRGCYADSNPNRTLRYLCYISELSICIIFVLLKKRMYLFF